MIYVKCFSWNYKTQLWKRGTALRCRLQKYNYSTPQYVSHSIIHSLVYNTTYSLL